MTYTQAQVDRGRALVANLGRSKWDIGDLALEIMPADAEMDGPERDSLDRFAEEIGLSFSALRVYRKVSLAFPVVDSDHGRRDDTDWGVHSELRAHEDGDAILHESATPWKVRTLRPRLGKAPKDGPASTGWAPSTHAERVTMTRSLLADKQVALEAMGDLHTRVAARAAGTQAGNDHYAAVQRDFELANPELVAHNKEVDKGIFAAGHALNTRALVLHAKADLVAASEEWSKAGGQPDDLDRRALNGIVALAQALLDGAESTSLDSVLADILGGQS